MAAFLHDEPHASVYSTAQVSAWLLRINLPGGYRQYIDTPANVPKTYDALRTLFRCQITTFVYENLSHHKGMIDTILNYCASCFVYHRLATNETFRSVAYELRSFHKDLCRTNHKRKFKDDGE